MIAIKNMLLAYIVDTHLIQMSMNNIYFYKERNA